MSTTTPPILLMIYNRPGLTEKVMEALRAVSPARLYIAADGPRADDPADHDRCQRARSVATAVDWRCDLRTLMRDRNLGCRDAVNGAIAWFFEHEKEGVILEDDCIAHPDFFRYCQILLSRYREDRRIMCITGNNLLPGTECGDSSYYFSTLDIGIAPSPAPTRGGDQAIAATKLR